MLGSSSDSVLSTSSKGNSGCNSAIAGMSDGLFIVLVALAAIVLVVLFAAVIRRVKRKSAAKAERVRESVALKEDENVSTVSESATDTSICREAARYSSI